jgi:hypothetical protein
MEVAGLSEIVVPIYQTKRHNMTVILGKINTVHNLTASSLNTHFDITLPLTPVSPKVAYAFDIPSKILHAFVTSSSIPHAPPILLNFIIIIIFGEEDELWYTSSCSLLQPPVALSVSSFHCTECSKEAT